MLFKPAPRKIIQSINLGGADSSAGVILLTAPQLAAGLQASDGSLYFRARGRAKNSSQSDLGGPFVVFEYTETAANTGLKYNTPAGTNIITYLRGVDAGISCGFTQDTVNGWNAGDVFVWEFFCRRKSAFSKGNLGWRNLVNFALLDGFNNGTFGSQTFSRPEFLPWQPGTSYPAGTTIRRLTGVNDHDPWIAVSLGGGTGNSGAGPNDPFPASPAQNQVITESTGLQWRLMTDATNGLALGPVTAFALGGELANTRRFGVLWDSITFYDYAESERTADRRATLVQLTDSIGATNGNLPIMQSQLLTQAQANARPQTQVEPMFVTLGRAGFQWENCRQVLLNSTFYQNQDPRVVGVSGQYSINNILANQAENVIQPGIAGIVTLVATNLPQAPYFAMQDLPFAGFAGWFAGAQTVWGQINADLLGGGNLPITGPNVVHCAFINALSDGATPPSLPAPMSSGDGLHPSILGKQNNAGQPGTAANTANQGLVPELTKAGIPFVKWAA